MSKLGQHFLINKRKIQKIVEALELRDGDTVIEIGPGHGELTTNFKSYSPIGGLNLKIIAIEKDKELVELNMKVAIAFGVLMIVGLLIYIAFYK